MGWNDRIVAGGPGHDDLGDGAGSAYVFAESAGTFEDAIVRADGTD